MAHLVLQEPQRDALIKHMRVFDGALFDDRSVAGCVQLRSRVQGEGTCCTSQWRSLRVLSMR